MSNHLRSCLAGIFLSLPATLGAAPIDKASDWLRSFETLTAHFEQVSQNGERASGTMLIRRPGRMRLDYDGKDAPLVIVGSGAVAVFDSASNTGPTQYPLSMTPLGPILSRNPDLARSEMIKGAVEHEGDIVVIAQDPDNPDYGSAQFFFSSDGSGLKRWVMISSAGDTTHLILSDIETGIEIGSRPFSISHEKEKRNPSR